MVRRRVGLRWPHAESAALAWLRRACRHAGLRETRIRIALFRWSSFGRARVPWPVLLGPATMPCRACGWRQ
jgi:hypothetical protein